MAASNPTVLPVTVLSQKQRKAAQRKERRKRKRQALAQARGDGNGGSCIPEDEVVNDEDGEDEDDAAKEERLQLHEAWLERERLAQEEFRLMTEREDAARRRREEEERMIKEEWEAQQKKEKDLNEQKRQEKRDKEHKRPHSLTNSYSTLSSHSEDEAVQKMLDEAENQLENGGPWMNPEAPTTEKLENFGTERDVANCPFFLKTGACRFGNRCSRKHIYPTSSPTLMIRSMFTMFGMEESQRDDYDIDACLEHTEEDLMESFLDFYNDVLPEFKSVGKVVQFKVSCNYEPHLRGNVYVQFDSEEQCKDAFIKFNGRWYAGRQIHCEMSPVTRWKNAICGLFDRQKCPKGKHCNFLHVFRNPSNEFWEADRDMHLSPDRSVRGSFRDGWQSERSWRQRRGSRSPPRSERSHSRRENSRRRSRSQERRSYHQDREDRWSRSRCSERRTQSYLSRSRSRDRARSRSRDRARSRSRDRARSRSRDTASSRGRARSRSRERTRNRSRERPRSRSRDREKDGHKNGSKEKDNDRNFRNKSEEGGRHEDKRDSRERSGSTEKERLSVEKSPRKTDKHKKRPSNDKESHSRHKRSKKSKKKSKKKHKRRSSLPDAATSSGESDKEEETEKETENNSSPTECGNEKEPILANSNAEVSVNSEGCGPEPMHQQSPTNLPETVT